MNYTINFNTHQNYKYELSSKRLYDFFDILNCKIFLETGTFNGNGIDFILNKNHYEKIFSIEIDKNKYEYCLNKFKNNSIVNIINDYSEKYLTSIIPTLKKPTFVYLDAHFDGFYPIIKESEIILQNFYNLDNILVCIDDERLFSLKLKNDIVNLYREKNFIDCYLDDSIIFCKKNWFKNL